jgi:hypothetical protein
VCTPTAAADPSAEEVGAAFARVVDLPGEVSLAAALIERGGPRFFLTQKAERSMPTGPKGEVASPRELVTRVHARRQSNLSIVHTGAASPGAVSKIWRIRSREGRLILVAAVWNGKAANLPALETAAEPLLKLMRER